MAKALGVQMIEIIQQWMEAEGTDVANLDAAAEWAVKNGKYQRQPISMRQQCKREMARAMRQARHVDPQNRKVRSKHPVIIPYEGEQLVFWVDIRTAKPDQMRNSLTRGWKAIADDVKRHAIDHISYNENNLYNAQIPLFDYNYNADAEEARLSGTYDDDGNGEYDDSDDNDDLNSRSASTAP